jgi:hypothetical protein
MTLIDPFEAENGWLRRLVINPIKTCYRPCPRIRYVIGFQDFPKFKGCASRKTLILLQRPRF